MKKKNNIDNNNILNIYIRFQSLFEEYINKPSDPTLANLLDLGKVYKEAWIEEAFSNPGNRSSYEELSKQFHSPKGFEQTISKASLVGNKNALDEFELNKLNSKSSEIKDLVEQDNSASTLELSSNLELRPKDFNLESPMKNSYGDRTRVTKKTEMHGDYTFDEFTAKKANKKSKKASTLKLVLAKEIVKQESPDKKTKIITQSIFSNDGVIGNPSVPIGSIDFYQHAIRAVREHENRFFNRRWYVEKSKDGTVQSPWWSDRGQHDQMIELANAKGFFQSYLDDPRLINEQTKIIFSGNLTDKEYSKYLREISFPSERKKLSSNSYYFVIFESQHDKTMDQMLDNLMAKKENQISHTWRDVCIFSPNEITYRVITDDKLAKPTIPIEDSPEWSISNDMSHLSNQAMKAFINFTHPGLKINNLDD